MDKDLHVTSVRSQEGDELVNTILPSYHMFEATIFKKLEPNEESFKEDPPTYEMSPLNSGGVTPVCTMPSPTPLPEPTEFPFPSQTTFNQNSAELWETTVLANVHKLDNLADLGNVRASRLNAKITFTDKVCQKGQKPDIVDLSQRELKQGDFIHGFVTIENTNSEPVPFDMVYVVFEGVLSVLHTSNGPRDRKQPPTVFKFLNMLDLFASWSYANIDRLATDSGDPHDWCEGETDPYDNTVLAIDVKRLFQPGVTYKRFFSFRVPDRLLDDTCDMHSLDSHCQLPPSLGPAANLNTDKRSREYANITVKDFSFMDTSVSYSVSVRVIGRLSQYTNRLEKDRYALVSEASSPLRILPYTSDEPHKEYWIKKVNSCYKAFEEIVKDKIAQGESVLASMKSESSISLTPQSSRSSLAPVVSEKARHLYHVSDSETKKSSFGKSSDTNIYSHLSPYRKKTLTGYSKVLGVFSLVTPKRAYKTVYVPPPKFRNPMQGYNTKVTIPVDLSYYYDESAGQQEPPEPKSLNVELVVLTIRSKKHYIPVELNHDMCFPDHIVDDIESKKPSEEPETFDTIVVKPFHDHYTRLVSLMKKIGFDNEAFRVETSLFKDIKSMAMLQTKNINLLFPSVEIESTSEKSLGSHKNPATVPWTVSHSSTNPNYKIHTKRMAITVDLATCRLKGSSEHGSAKNAYDSFCLVPEFQLCLVARLYYFRITIKHKNGATQTVHVPLSIEDS
ncbi:Bul1 N terminus family protein [Clavispora lusitaniae]|uniref:Uncharacterized protein n=2 Tax=Clavispora lusitaniae TaxID=36911 RepID=C4Y8F2_CLAL4|nr:uncharacterized protein CLUG_04480 [Clavispora lusitaniae ATCC 42720]EEQ40352.1 hypothetical protein CLUG_04480 [Clavispora lusitaniae ATCC 42720]KAF7581708.1 Bul1 N terminus family protein [Clavispora lusitaniae]OVF09548.1 hypothetical protein A9F13_04g00176 [Clavispora lusitaniae]